MKKIAGYVGLVLLVLQAWGCGSGSSPFETTTTTTTTTTTPSGVQSGGTLGALQDLGDLNGDPLNNWFRSEGLAINDLGAVAGSSLASEKSYLWDPATAAVSWLGGHVVDFAASPLEYRTYDDYYGTTGTKTLYYAVAIDINNNGLAVGNSATAPTSSDPTEFRAFVSDGATFIDLAPIIESTTNPGVYDNIQTNSKAVAINDNNYVVVNIGNGTNIFPYYWDGVSLAPTLDPEGNTFPLLTPLPIIFGAGSAEVVALSDTTNKVVIDSGNTSIYFDIDNGIGETIGVYLSDASSSAADVNDNGQVTGTSGTLGYFWEAGSMTRINSLGGSTCTPVAINNNAQVVGNATTSNGATHAFLWQINTSGTPVLTDLGTLGGADSHATAINDLGWVVGYSETGGTFVDATGVYDVEHAFLWVNGVMYDLGVHNDFYDYPFIDSYPFSRATDVSNTGIVVGNSTSPNNNSRAFRLTPTFP